MTFGSKIVLPKHSAGNVEYLEVRRRDGTVIILPGPAARFFDPVEDIHVHVREARLIDASEALVVYRHTANKVGEPQVQRRVVLGPARFIPSADEWVHEFEWSGVPKDGSKTTYQPKALRFTKLRVIPASAYHNVSEVRTNDDTLITVKLMLFFELRDVEKMLDATNDPIGDFINAASADVIAFCAGVSYETFLNETHRLNELDTFAQLCVRAHHIGYDITKVVFRGFQAGAKLQARRLAGAACQRERCTPHRRPATIRRCTTTPSRSARGCGCSRRRRRRSSDRRTRRSLPRRGVRRSRRSSRRGRRSSGRSSRWCRSRRSWRRGGFRTRHRAPSRPATLQARLGAPLHPRQSPAPPRAGGDRAAGARSGAAAGGAAGALRRAACHNAGDEGDGSRLDQGAGVAARGSRQGHQARHRRHTGGGGQKVAAERDPAQLVKRRPPRDALSRGRIPSRAPFVPFVASLSRALSHALLTMRQLCLFTPL